MLKTKVLHPQILAALGSSGHGSRVMIADGNYPFATKSPKGCEIVYLNFRPGLIGTLEILQGLTEMIVIESATVMQPPEDFQAPIFDEYRRLLGGMELNPLPRFDFYDMVKEPETSLVIASGEQQRFANLLLTIGVVK